MVASLSPAGAASPLGPARYSAILVDADTNKILYADAAEQIRHPASITKVMTLFLTFDAIAEGRLKLTDRITISRHAAGQAPSKLGIPAGGSLSVEDAIRVVAVKSANDIAVALAERVGGTENKFAAAMTNKARALGMRQTVFTNATGLPDAGNFTTARDLAVLSIAIMRAHPRHYHYFGERSFVYGQQALINHNRLLGVLPGMDGLKTGYTIDSGFTLAASAIRNGRRLVAVVLGEPSTAVRNERVSALINAGFIALQRRAQGEQVDVASLMPPVPDARRAKLPATILARYPANAGGGAD
jgi:D-alanyl-D-alanine carboxypeptidase